MPVLNPSEEIRVGIDLLLICIREGPPEGWKDLRLEYTGARPASDPENSKIRW